MHVPMTAFIGKKRVLNAEAGTQKFDPNLEVLVPSFSL